MFPCLWQIMTVKENANSFVFTDGDAEMESVPLVAKVLLLICASTWTGSSGAKYVLSQYKECTVGLD